MKLSRIVFGNLLKKNILFLILIPIIIISQVMILEPHLKYGFSDVDWGFLSFYKTQNPYTLSQFIKNIEVGGTRGGVYTHQIYYIGIQNDLYGLDFKSFQITTHVFKILATLAVFPLLLAISGSRLVAFIATILFGFSYSAVGTMYTVVTSSDYSAILSMGIFVLMYWYIVKKDIGNWFLLLLLLLLLILTLFLSTERMYQLPLLICLTEVFLFWQKRKLGNNTVRRLLIMFIPIIFIFLAKPMVFLSYFLSHIVEIVQGIGAGNWNLLLTPFIALGSIIIPHNYTKYLGVAKMDNFGSFLEFLITGPLFILVVVTLAIGKLVFKKSRIVILQILRLMILFSILLYILGGHFVGHQISVESIMQALVGLYILALSIVSLLSWLKQKDRLLIGLFVGPFFAFLYILLTWVGTAASEVFAGVHRYLTIPSIGISIFIASLAIIIFQKLFYLFKYRSYLKIISIIPFILVLIFIRINVKGIQDFFNNQLYNGFGASEKQIMRSQLNSYLTNLSSNKPSLFYFDFTEDNINGYYYDNTVLAGFPTWMLWNEKIKFNSEIAPVAFWNQLQTLTSLVKVKDGKKGLLYNGKFYEMENFYAFKLKDKRVRDIKDEVLSQLEI